MSRRLPRRNFLRGATAAGAATAAGFAIGRSPRAQAGWGQWPEDKAEALVPESRRATRVLELQLVGGVGAFDGFYTVPGWGQGNGTFLHVFPAERDARFEACGFGNASTELTEPFFDDEMGTTVHLGPWLVPLRQRPDILNRMRIVVQRHDQLAHEGANPLSLTGDRLGTPRLAGIGAAIQRHFAERPGGVRPAPYAYILYPGAGFATHNVLAASAVGLHPGSARPLSVTVESNSLLNQLLARPGVTDQDAFDDLVDYYAQRYRGRFQPRGIGAPTRSAERDTFEFAHLARKSATDLQDILSADLFAPIARTECGDPATSMPAMQARLAASLLTRTTDRASYVHWIDTGLIPNPDLGHDTHNNHVEFASRNVSHSIRELMEIINAPGENDPAKIDLDDTMVVINTEFGRTPTLQGATGLNHWPQGYVNVFIGGPIESRGIYGHITEAQGQAQNWVRPAENRMMVLSAMGIYPFSSQSFAVADVAGGVADELEAARRVKEVYLGVED